MKLTYAATTALSIVAMPLLWATAGFTVDMVPDEGAAPAWEVGLTLSLALVAFMACIGHIALTIWLGLTAMEAQE